MKAQCERCGESVELSFAPAQGGIDVTCPSCRASYFVPSVAVPAAAEAPPARPGAGEQECPKCGLVQASAEACRRCGLVFVRWKGAPTPDDGQHHTSEAERREGAALWAACEAGWDDAARHDAFIVYCQRTAQLPFAAGCYRAAQVSRAGAAEPVATRALDRVAKLAITTLELSGRRAAAPAGRMPYKSSVALLALALFLLVGGLLWAIFYQQQRDRRLDEPEERVVPVVPLAKPP